MAPIYNIQCQQSHCRTRRMGMQIPCIYLPFLTNHFVQDFHKTHSPHFTLTTILPTYIGGPNVLPLTKGIDSLSFSQGRLWKTATDASELPKPDWPGWVDVRDVAKAHVNALVTPQAAGKRWILCTALATYSDVRSPFYSVGHFQIS